MSSNKPLASIKKSVYNGSLLIKEYYPEISKSFKYNGRTLKDVAKIIKEDKFKDTPLKAKSLEQIIKYLNLYFKGGNYKDQILKPAIEDYDLIVEKKKKTIAEKNLKKLKKVRQYKNFTKKETNFIIKEYNNKNTPKEIYNKYKTQEKFNQRNYNSISLKLDDLREKKLIGKQNINWDGDIGFMALYLFNKYDKTNNYLKENSKSLDEYFFNGNEIVTSQKLNNFYRKNT